MENFAIDSNVQETAVTGAYKTDALSHGIGNGKVSSQWWNRPDDQKFLSLEEMREFKRRDYDRMNQRIVDTHKMRVRAIDDNTPHGELVIDYTDKNHDDVTNRPTHWSFGQLSQLAGAPAGYLRDMPAKLAEVNLNWGLRYNRSSQAVQLYGEGMNGDLRAATGERQQDCRQQRCQVPFRRIHFFSVHRD